MTIPIMDLEDSNLPIDIADQIIQVPRASDVRSLSNPEEYLVRLNEISSPSERLMIFLKSIPNINGTDSTHESKAFRKLLVCSTVGAFVIGGLFMSKDVHQDYQRKHNASIFENKHIAHRHFWDTLVSGVGSKGMHYGFKAFGATASLGLVTFGSIVYRGELYLPDWFVGWSTIGALSRTWLGPRAMAAGGLIGGVAGVAVFGIFQAWEYLSGHKYSQLRLLEHRIFLEKRHNTIRYNQKLHEAKHLEHMQDMHNRGHL